MIRKFKVFTFILVALMLALGSPVVYAAAMTDEAVLGNNRWSVQNDGDIIPNTDSSYDIGASGAEVDNIYADSVWVGGTEYTSFAAGTDGNWTDTGLTLTLDQAPTKFIATYSSGDFFATGFTIGTGDITFANGQKLDGDTNATFKIIEASDTLTFGFNGSEVTLDTSDGGFVFLMTQADGTVAFKTNNDSDDYLNITTVSDVPTITTSGTSNLEIAPDGGTVTVTGALTATGLATAAGVTTSTTITLENSETIVNSTNNTVEIGGGTGTVLSVLDAGTGDSDATLLLRADASADNGDDWQIVSDGGTNSLFFQNDATGSQATYLTLSNVGVITTTGDVVVAGTTPLVTIGDGGDEDAGIQFNSDTNDFYIASENGADDLVIGAGSVIGTTPIISMTDAGVTTVTGSTDGVLSVWGAGTDASDAYIRLVGDAQTDVNDSWQIWNDSSNAALYIGSDSAVAGTYVTKLTIAGATGNLTMAGDVLTLGDGEAIDNSVDDTVTVSSNDASIFVSIYSPLATDGDATLSLLGDAGADAKDRWDIVNDTGDHKLYIKTDASVADTMVTQLTIDSADGDITTIGDLEIADDMDLVFGTNSDWLVQYDEGVDDQLLFITAGTAAAATTDPMVEFLVGGTPTANQQVFGVGKGTQASNTALFTVDEDGDVEIAGTTTASGAVSMGYEMVTTTAADPGLGTASVSKIFTAITSDATGSAADVVSLAAGMAGQVKIITLAVDAETTGTSISANFAGATAAALLEDAGDMLILVSDGTEWYIVYNNGATLS
jgi:hypothetical protein